MKYTLEQREYIENFKKDYLVAIFALAGTGKTTLLLAVAKANPELKGIYIV